MAGSRQFGVSTQLFESQRLGREHLAAIASYGFTAIELRAARTHFDYCNPAVVADLQQWLGEAGLVLTSIEVPPAEDVEAALLIARRVPVSTLVVKVGAPREARRLVERLAGVAAPLAVTIAVDSTSMSPAGSLVHFVEEGTEAVGIGICLDFGQSHVDGDLVEALETVSGHLAAAHVHDSRGRRDEHLAPFEGTIDWPAALTAVQKIGYDGTMVFDVAAHGSPRDALAKLKGARQRIEKLLDL